MATFLLIIVVLFIIITSTISVIVKSYGVKVKSETLSGAANSCAVYIRNAFNEEEHGDFNTFITKERDTLTLILDLLCANDESIIMFITDAKGQMVHFDAHDNGKTSLKDILKNTDECIISDKIQTLLASGEHVSSADDMDGFFRADQIYYGIPLFNDGRYAGAIFACAHSTDTDALLSTMTRTVTLAVLWIMLASLIAVYFITERFTAPIKSMSRAARSFANGSFDARVDAIGNDEVAELARAFNNMASSLQNLEEMRRSFLANVSHDLRTPMTTISGFIDGIIDGAIPPEQHEYYLGVIAGEVRRLSRLVSQLLDISRIEAGERKFTPVAFDICEQGREIIISNIQRLEDKKLDVRFECEADNMYVLADRDAIHQIFYNICDNAIKFSNEGGVFEIRIYEKGSVVFVSVYNEGEGITEEDLPYIFERFYKSDKSRGKDKTGVGLGMHIARAIIEAHGQKIWVESDHTKWCRFTFTLQAAKADKQKLRTSEDKQ